MDTTVIIGKLKEQVSLRMNQNTPRIKNCLDRLTEDEVWRRPNASSNSIGNLILHLCGNIRQYMISSLGNRADDRQRSQEFSARGGMNKTDLFQKLSDTVDEALSTMEQASTEELLKVRPVQAFEMSGIGILLHVMEHYSYHTGQIAFYTKLLKDNDLGFYSGVKLD